MNQAPIAARKELASGDESREVIAANRQALGILDERALLIEVEQRTKILDVL
jgi:hypothetical protein